MAAQDHPFDSLPVKIRITTSDSQISGHFVLAGILIVQRAMIV